MGTKEMADQEIKEQLYRNMCLVTRCFRCVNSVDEKCRWPLTKHCQFEEKGRIITKRRCDKCEWWSVHPNGKTGACIRFPPRTEAVLGVPTNQYPIMQMFNWCGEFKEKEK